MKKKRFVILAALALSLINLDLFAQDDLAVAIAGIKSKYDGTKTMTCQFVQKNIVSSGEVEAVFKGEMYYVASPKKNLWRYITPISYGILFEGDRIDIREGKKVKEGSKINKNKLLDRLEILTNVLSPDKMRSEFELKPSIDGGRIRILMSPIGKCAKKNYRGITLAFSAETFLIESATITRKNGDALTVDFLKIVVDEPIDDGIFRIL